MSSFDILDSQGASLIGFYQRDRNIQKIHWAQCFGNNALLQTGINFNSWTQAPREAFVTGSNSGFAILTGNETLQFTTPATLAPASYLIDIRAWNYENILIDNSGNIKTTRI